MRVWASAKARNGRFSKFALEFGARLKPETTSNPVFLKGERGRGKEAPRSGRREEDSYENASIVERSGG